MGFEDVLGHERPIGQLRAAIAAGRVHHAYLFSGPEGVGKERVAAIFAQSLQCEADPEARPCGGCEACRKVEHHNHPDVQWVLPEAERVARKELSRGELDHAPSRELRITDVRELERRVRLPPYEGRHKVVVLTPADRMNVSAQNALLKTLEEPPAATTLILVTAAPDALLPTVRSRCARIPFGPIPLEVVAAELESRTGCDAAAARVLATLSGGSLGAALALDPETVTARRELIGQVRGLDPANGAALTGFAESFAEDKEDADRNLGLVTLWYRDVLAMQSGAGPELLANADLIDAAKEDAARLSAQEILRRLALIREARRGLSQNVNARLVVEAMIAGFGGR